MSTVTAREWLADSWKNSVITNVTVFRTVIIGFGSGGSPLV